MELTSATSWLKFNKFSNRNLRLEGKRKEKKTKQTNNYETKTTTKKKKVSLFRPARVHHQYRGCCHAGLPPSQLARQAAEYVRQCKNFTNSCTQTHPPSPLILHRACTPPPLLLELVCRTLTCFHRSKTRPTT